MQIRNLSKVFFNVLIVLALAAGIAFSPPRPIQAFHSIIYVNSGAAGANDGSSWTDAYTDLQGALGPAVSGQQVWVAAGTYKPGPSNNPTSSFYLKDGVAIYGGFPSAGDSHWLDRDWATNVTILSGDLDSSGGFSSADAYNVVTALSVSSTSILDGFTITGGNALDGHSEGGGIFIGYDCSPTLNHLIIGSNTATNGGGGMSNHASPVLNDVIFRNNTSTGMGLGGGLFELGVSTLNNVTFDNNSANGSNGQGGGFYGVNSSTMHNVVFKNNSAGGSIYHQGGGMFVAGTSGATLSMDNVTFSNNHADEGGGFAWVNSSGASSTYAVMSNVEFLDNTASRGAGLYIDSNSPTAVLAVTNALFAGNTVGVGHFGGGINAQSGTIHLTNATFSGNSAGTAGAFAMLGPVHIDLTNCIFYGNTAGNDTPDIYNVGSATLSYCDYDPALSHGIGAVLTTGSINADPLFVSSSDFRLQSTSPAIDVGSNAAVPGNVTTDLGGDSRIFNEVVDMGAYEYQPVSSNKSTVSAAPPNVVADGATTSNITVTLLDVYSGPVSGKAVTLAKTSGPGTPTIDTVSGNTDSSGIATFTVKSTMAGAVDFTATDVTDNITISQTANVTFEAGAVSASASTVSALPLSVVADGSATSGVTVTLFDAYNNPVSGRAVTLAKTAGPGSPTVTTTQGTTNVAGVATFTVKSTTAGADNFTATDSTDSIAISQTAAVTFEAGPVSAGTSTVSASPPSVVADGSATSAVTVTLLDANGNAVSGKAVTLAKTAGPGTPTVTTTQGTTDVAGVATFTAKSTTAGADNFTATDFTDNITISQTATVTFEAGPVSADTSTVSAAPLTVVADGSATSDVTVTLLDANNNAVSGKAVTLAKTSGPGTPTVATISGNTDSSGIATFTVKSTTAGADNFTATDVTDTITVNQTASVTFLASVPAATGTGNATFTTSDGFISDLTALSEASQPANGKPANVVFPDGFFSFHIVGLSPGAKVTVTITLPSSVPVGTQYWKYQSGRGWYAIPIGDDDGDNVITIQLTDGGSGDSDGANGDINDPGAPGFLDQLPRSVGGEVTGISKMGLLMPWLIMVFVLGVGGTLLVLRRRKGS